MARFCPGGVWHLTQNEMQSSLRPISESHTFYTKECGMCRRTAWSSWRRQRRITRRTICRVALSGHCTRRYRRQKNLYHTSWTDFGLLRDRLGGLAKTTCARL